jgi:hypothetical protein
MVRNSEARATYIEVSTRMKEGASEYESKGKGLLFLMYRAGDVA